MTGPDNQDTRPISVAELLARNGTIGAPPVGGRRRLRRGNTDSVTVAELTGEIPIIGVEDDEPGAAGAAATTNGTVDMAAEAAFPASDVSAEDMRPDPGYADADADHEDEDADADAELSVQERDFDEYDEPPSYLHAVREPLFGGRFEDDLRRDGPRPRDEPYPRIGRQVRSATAAEKDHDEDQRAQRMQQIGRGALIVVQSMLAVAFGAGLFIAFDQLWKWNNIVALVLSVLVILGLVVGVRIVRKTEDIGSTLIAVAVGALVTLGPLALLQSG
jgi:F0F1-type ATP synthase assembly protein I